MDMGMDDKGFLWLDHRNCQTGMEKLLSDIAHTLNQIEFFHILAHSSIKGPLNIQYTEKNDQ